MFVNAGDMSHASLIEYLNKSVYNDALPTKVLNKKVKAKVLMEMEDFKAYQASQGYKRMVVNYLFVMVVEGKMDDYALKGELKKVNTKDGLSEYAAFLTKILATESAGKGVQKKMQRLPVELRTASMM